MAGIAALLAFGAVELPVALLVLGGHLLVKQHHSRYLSVVGEIMEDVWGAPYASNRDAHPPRASIIAERFTFVAAVRGISSTNSTVLGTL